MFTCGSLLGFLATNRAWPYHGVFARCGRAYDAKAASILAMRVDERTCLGRGHTFEEFSPVLAADHDGVDILHGQRIAVSERGCRRTKLLGQRAESPTAIVVPDDAMLRGQVAVERVGERATL